MHEHPERRHLGFPCRSHVNVVFVRFDRGLYTLDAEGARIGGCPCMSRCNDIRLLLSTIENKVFGSRGDKGREPVEALPAEKAPAEAGEGAEPLAGSLWDQRRCGGMMRVVSFVLACGGAATRSAGVGVERMSLIVVVRRPYELGGELL
jgi:hypothetical protein